MHALKLATDGGCELELDRRLEEAGASTECNDVGPCSVGGAPGRTGTRGTPWVVVALGLGALASARRRRARLLVP